MHPLLGAALDVNQRWIMDLGIPGPDAGKGGNHLLLKNLSGSSADLYFGPSAPAGNEDKWIKTIPDKGWFVYFRVYGPQQAAFDGSWKPGDFEEVTSMGRGG
jgi:hypothetical protein